MTDQSEAQVVLVTGASGYIGRLVVQALAPELDGRITKLIASDVRTVSAHARVAGVTYETVDIRGDELSSAVERHGVDTIVHLAAVVTPGPGDTRDFQYSVDVDGTRNVLEAAVAHGVTKLIYTSSGAAYGYSADNPALLFEDEPLRGNEVFAYSWHKRLVEEMLAEYRDTHPELKQLVFRVSTVLGAEVDNQITAMFERPVVVGIRGSDTPFCFIWDRDVVGCVVAGVLSDRVGVYNCTGDGVMTLREAAHAMGRRFLALPLPLLRAGLGLLHERELSSYGPEQVLFLQHRPVLANERLKTEFGYVPRKSSREVFELYRSSRAG